MEKCFASLVVLVLVLSSTQAAEDNTKNHRLEKRQDASYFFGGWRPLRPATSTSYFHTAASGRYHNLMSSLPGSLEAASRYYASLPSATNYKDIFSYYPRPAIKHRPKKNTPIYMERLKPKRQQQQPQQKYGARGLGGGAPQIVDIQNIDLKQIQGLQDLLLQAKELPLTQLSLPSKGGNPFDLLQLSLQSLPQDSYNTGSQTVSRYNNRNKRPQASKGAYGNRMPQTYAPAQMPLQFQYIEMPKMKNLVPQFLSQDISISPVHIPHQIRSIEDILRGMKNIQVVEVPLPAATPASSGKSSQGYGSRATSYSQPQYQARPAKSSSKVSFPMNTYYTHQSQQQPRQQYSSQAKPTGYGQKQPQIEAELVKLSEDEIQRLLSKLQLVQKNSQDFLKVLPFAQAAAAPHQSGDGQVQLIHLTLPEGHQVHVQQDEEKPSGYGSKSYAAGQDDGYKGGEQQQYVAIPQGDGYKGREQQQYVAIPQGDGYKGREQQQYVAIPQDDGYGSGEQQQYVAIPQDDGYSSAGNEGGYQIENQEVQHNAAGYQIEDQDGRSQYGSKYQAAQDMPSYGQSASYEQDSKSQGYAREGQQEYKQSGYGSTAQQPGQYLEIMSPPSKNGYRREPVLAVEIQKGQSIEDVIKAIDPKTLQQLGAHGKEGLEIEVVEVPVQEEYSSESKKAETYVASTNATTEAPIRRSSSATTTTVSQDKSTTTTTGKKAKS